MTFKATALVAAAALMAAPVAAQELSIATGGTGRGVFPLWWRSGRGDLEPYRWGIRQRRSDRGIGRKTWR